MSNNFIPRVGMRLIPTNTARSTYPSLTEEYYTILSVEYDYGSTSFTINHSTLSELRWLPSIEWWIPYEELKKEEERVYVLFNSNEPRYTLSELEDLLQGDKLAYESYIAKVTHKVVTNISYKMEPIEAS